MNVKEMMDQLDGAASEVDFPRRAQELMGSWSSTGAGSETIEPILRFMEAHPTVDYGMPGPLVHFVEQFYGSGYEDQLVESVRRRPTPHTAWMLNRVINGTADSAVRGRLIAVMKEAMRSPLADRQTAERISGFLDRHLQLEG